MSKNTYSVQLCRQAPLTNKTHRFKRTHLTPDLIPISMNSIQIVEIAKQLIFAIRQTLLWYDDNRQEAAIRMVWLRLRTRMRFNFIYFSLSNEIDILRLNVCCAPTVCSHRVTELSLMSSLDSTEFLSTKSQVRTVDCVAGVSSTSSSIQADKCAFMDVN